MLSTHCGPKSQMLNLIWYWIFRMSIPWSDYVSVYIVRLAPTYNRHMWCCDAMRLFSEPDSNIQQILLYQNTHLKKFQKQILYVGIYIFTSGVNGFWSLMESEDTFHNVSLSVSFLVLSFSSFFSNSTLLLSTVWWLLKRMNWRRSLGSGSVRTSSKRFLPMDFRMTQRDKSISGMGAAAK